MHKPHDERKTRVGSDQAGGPLFATIDFAVNLLALLTQVFATGQFLKRFGIAK